MKRFLSVIVLLALLCSLAVRADGTDEILPKPKAENGESSSKEEIGILGTFILIYTKVRDGVKYAYDEIQYWKGQLNTYKAMGDWADNAYKKLGVISSNAVTLVRGKGDIFAKLEQAETLCNSIDDVAFNETRKFDQLLARSERLYDASINEPYYDGKDTIRVLSMVPNTEEALNYLNQFLSGTDTATITDRQKAYMTPSEQAQMQQELDGMKAIAGSTYKDSIPEKVLANSDKMIAASSLAKSAMYKTWAGMEVDNANQLSSSFDAAQSINEKEAAASWFFLEEVNANNHEIRHSLEELKVYQALLGTDTWNMSNENAGVESQKMSYNMMGSAVSAAQK